MNFEEKLGKGFLFYEPKFMIKSFKKNKLTLKEISLLDDYIFCFNEKFKEPNIINLLRNCKGLKYFLTDFLNEQTEIEKFISKCKENEDENGFIKSTFFEFKSRNNYEFISGPFTNMIFSIIEENKLSIKALIGNYRATVSKEENLFRPV